MSHATLHRRNVYIVDGLRTPFLKFRGNPGAFSASDLAMQVCRVLINRQIFASADFSEVITGCVMPQATEANISRVIGLRAGIPMHVPAMTVQRNCASGLQALDTASINIHAGASQLTLAGGTEAMSHAPLLCSKELTQWLAHYYQAKGLEEKFLQFLKLKPHYLKLTPSLKQGLVDPVVDLSMGQTAENLAYRFNISRQAMDEFSILSHQRVALAQENGYFEKEILSVYDYNGNVYSADDGLRRDTSLEKLAQLKPQFDPRFGMVTAGNSSQVSDGAAFLILADAKTVKKYQLPVLARLVDVTWAGVDPAEMGIGPVPAIATLLHRHKLKLSDIDLWEINEAFAAQILAVKAALSSAQYCQEFLGMSHAIGDIDPACLNVDGGAIAIGHPVGASGARLALHMVHALTRTQKNRGIVSLCIGGGQGGAMLIERISEITE